MVHEFVETLSPGHGLLPARCDVVRLEDGQLGVRKDFSASRGRLRRALGRIAVARECRAYTRLRGIAGIPRLLGIAGESTFLVEYVSGKPVCDVKLRHVLDFVGQFEQLLTQMHSRGVTHGEIRFAHVLADGADRPWLVDFATATVTDPARPSGLFRLQRRLDRHGWLLIKERLLSGRLSAEERAELRRNRLLAGVLRRNMI